jgi:hypothetical protein
MAWQVVASLQMDQEAADWRAVEEGVSDGGFNIHFIL